MEGIKRKSINYNKLSTTDKGPQENPFPFLERLKKRLFLNTLTYIPTHLRDI